MTDEEQVPAYLLGQAVARAERAEAAVEELAAALVDCRPLPADLRAALARIAAMIAAGDRLLEYDAHLVECRLHRIGGQPASECDCGWYVDAANWQRATERSQPMAADAYTTPDWPRSVCVTLSLPPSWNNALHAVPGRGRVLSAEARAWKEQAGWLTRQALTGVEPLTPPLTVSLFAYGLSRKRDLDGCLKIAIDAVCEAMGVDDRYVDEVYAVRVLSRDGPRLDVVVSELTREERA